MQSTMKGSCRFPVPNSVNELDEPARTRFIHLVSSLFDGDALSLLKYVGSSAQANRLLGIARHCWRKHQLSVMYDDYLPLLADHNLARFVLHASCEECSCGS